MARSDVKENLVLAAESEAPVVDSPYVRSRLKRVTDLIMSFVGISITVAVFPVVALLIKMNSRGPVFYRQQRLGLDGRRFELIKFRTMVLDAEMNGYAVWALENDPRVTWAGWILRRLYLDELPQWWNVAKGDMSAVGPRPERPELTRLIVQRFPHFAKRLDAKPGITGLAQIEYRYTSSVDDSRHKLRYDLKYIRDASIKIDLWIIVRTLRMILLRRGT